MYYLSTRNNKIKVSAAEAIAKGISADGGLFVPECIPQLTNEDFKFLQAQNYIGRAKFVLKKYLTDFTESEIDYCVNGAYSGSFENDIPAPLKKVSGNKYSLELWHGPTCAFKDLALQLLPYLLTTATKKLGSDKQTVILVATSGDTGKAALEGFADVPNTKIMVFYPNNGVSDMQKLQMDTQKGDNVCVYAINGNFDDAQSGVKSIFTDANIIAEINKNGFEFSSANSINWGRLVPQIVYYVSAYCDLLNSDEDLSDGFDVTVPTGNFGNILAAYYAKQMGVPIKKLVCASNSNNVLTDFIKTGTYNRNRKFYTTISPSMDILISSNLERMLYLLTNGNDSLVAEWQANLSKCGKFTVPAEILNKLQSVFYGGCCNEENTKATINNYYNNYGYLCDTHTAVAFAVCDEYTKNTARPMIVASTASPYKFVESVLSAIGFSGNSVGFNGVRNLNKLTNAAIPESIKLLESAKPRFSNVCEKEDMKKAVYGFLNI